MFWGDEIEGHLIQLDHKEKKVKLLTDTAELYKKHNAEGEAKNYEIHQEYGQWMIETTPKMAYSTLCSWQEAIINIRNRASDIRNCYLSKNQHFLTIPVFPILGCKEYDYFDTK